MDDYFNVDEVESALGNLASNYQANAALITLPVCSYEGRVSHALRIFSGGPGARNTVILTGGLHAREWGTCEALVFFATDLLSAYTTKAGIAYAGKSFSDVEVARLLQGIDIIVFPLVNPDGRAFSQLNDAVITPGGWRKNRNPAASGGLADKIGVDINRNFDIAFDFRSRFLPFTVDTSDDPELETYCGPFAFSEAETINVRWLLDSTPNVRWLVDIHTGTKGIFYNWGIDQNQPDVKEMNFQNQQWDHLRGGRNDTYGEYQPDADVAVGAALVKAMKDAIFEVRGHVFPAEPAFSRAYALSGTLGDYVYARRYMNPTSAKVHGFVIEADEVLHPPWPVMATVVDDLCAALFQFCLSAPPLSPPP